MARRVARRVEHREVDTGKCECFAMVKIRQWAGDHRIHKTIGFGAEECSELFTWMACKVHVIGMEVCCDTTGRDGVDSTSMVDVAMGNEQRNGVRSFAARRSPTPRGSGGASTMTAGPPAAGATT